MNTTVRLILLFLAFLFAGNVSLLALDPDQPFSFKRHKVWTVEDGLPMNSVISIARTRDGYLWLGTEAGLARFDGLEFEIFSHENTPELANDLILSLLGDAENGLWIGTRGGGLVHYKDSGFTSYKSEHGLAGNEVWALLETGGGAVWIGTRKGLNRFQNGVITRIPLPAKMPNHNVRALLEDHLGRIWAGTRGGGLVKIEKIGNRLEAENKGMEGINITALLESRDGQIYISTAQAGLIRLNGEHRSDFTTKNGLPVNFTRCLLEDGAGNIWIGTQGGGICVLKNGENHITIYTRRGDFTSNSIYSIFEDHEHSFWIGTEGGGLNCLRDTAMTTYTVKNGLSYDIATGVFQDSRHNIWISNFGFGVDCFNPAKNQFKNYSTANGLSVNSVVCMAETPDGMLWFGMMGAGVNQLNPATNKIKTFDTGEGLSDSVVRALYVDKEGVLWAGTDSGGLHRYSNGRFVLYGNVKFRINTLHKDDTGAFWAGTWGGGLYRLRHGKTELFGKSNGRLSSDNIMSIYQDRDGVFWVGTYGGGLIRFRAGKEINAEIIADAVSKKDGLPDDTIYCIIEDRKHYLWMSSNRGIFRLGRRELMDYFDRKINRLHPTRFTSEDGMKSIECNGGSSSSGVQSHDGKLWFPTTMGVTVVDPENIGIETLPPPVQVKKAIINGNSFSPHEPVHTLAGEGNVELHYTGLSLVVPKNIRFKYKLEGFNDEWVDAGTRRLVYYTNLSPGSYRFRVIARNRDGVWNNKGASFEFILKPRYYQTLWFKILLPLFILVLSAVTYFLVRKWIILYKQKHRYGGATLADEDVKTHMSRIDYLLEMEKVFKDPDITLASLASRCSVSPRTLSQMINEKLGKHFNEFINQYRVAEAKKLLVSPPYLDKTILEIGYEVGFSSKSAFNRAFKFFTQMTPSQFREKYKDANS